ncbi:MAG: hypothetical protein GY720_06375 [bacterium]|nr:hypothetical protein [bacterium]
MPARLKGLRRRFERWRRTRKVRTRIPEPLWAAAVKLAGRYGIHRTAKALRVDYYALKKRVEQNAVIAGARQNPAATASKTAAEAEFLELPAAAWHGSGESTLELEDAGGAKLRVHLKGFAAPDLAALSRSFWQSES